MTYEQDYTRHHDNDHHTQIAILTGMPIEEIIQAQDRAVTSPWCGKTYINTFRSLGFNTNHRFIKFKPDTPYPCMMRYIKTGSNEPYWYSTVYYDGNVYFGYGDIRSFDNFIAEIKGKYRVTSMLQVWI